MNAMKTHARNATMEAWQEKWNITDVTGQWTRRLIRDVRTSINCGHTLPDYYLTQVLIGDGVFRAYALRLKNGETDTCMYYGIVDTVEHTTFEGGGMAEKREWT